jgi:hypothetical protein
MPIEITAAEAGANILAHVAEKRLVRISGIPGEWRPRQKWMDPVSLLEAIHPNIKGSGDCPVSLMPQWLASCSFELFNGLPRKDIYLFAERYGQLLAAGAMAKADHALRDRWLAFVVREALASARQIAITNKPYWRLAEASCELAITALAGRGSRDVAAKAAQAAQEAAPVFEKFPTEGQSIGRLLVGYDVLEIALCRCVADAVNDLDMIVKKMFRRRSQVGRIRTAIAIGRKSYAELGIVDLFDEVICEMRHCLDIRNQFAHCEFYEDPDREGNLLFANVKELATQRYKIEELTSVPAKRITKTLLEEQETFFTYVWERFSFLKCEARVRPNFLSLE